MKRIGLIFLMGVALLLLMITAGCKPEPTPPPEAPVTEPTEPSVVEPGEEGIATAPPEEKPATQEPTAIPLGEKGAAIDIPIHEGAYKLQVMQKGNSVIYQVDLTIEEVVAWYQEILPQYGWELAGPPDSAVGAIATMLRENANHDRLTINMQSNELAGFVSITLQVIRAAR